MKYESDAERDFVEFIRSQSDSLDIEWAEVADGSLDIRAIIEPIFERVGGDAAEAQSLGDQYTEGFLGYIRSRNGDIGTRTQRLIDQAVAKGYEPPGSLYAGRYPTHSFNAQAQFEGDTRLILIHTGFERLLIEGSRLLFAIHDKLITEKVERWPEPSWWAEVTLEDLIDQFSELLVSFVADAEPEPIYLDENVYPFEPDHELPAFTAAASAQDFALAHELGHVFSRHLKRNQVLPLRRLRTGLEVMRPDWAQEFEADLFAGRLLFCSEPESEEQKVLDLLYGKYIGAGLFFDFDVLICAIEARAFDVPLESEETHPPARQREARMLSSIRSGIVSPSLFIDRRAIGRTFRKVRDVLLARSVEMIQAKGL